MSLGSRFAGGTLYCGEFLRSGNSKRKAFPESTPTAAILYTCRRLLLFLRDACEDGLEASMFPSRFDEGTLRGQRKSVWCPPRHGLVHTVVLPIARLCTKLAAFACARFDILLEEPRRKQARFEPFSKGSPDPRTTLIPSASTTIRRQHPKFRAAFFPTHLSAVIPVPR